jgi:hypothetical protein
VVECDEGEQLPRIVARLCHRALAESQLQMQASRCAVLDVGLLETVGESVNLSWHNGQHGTSTIS